MAQKPAENWYRIYNYDFLPTWARMFNVNDDNYQLYETKRNRPKNNIQRSYDFTEHCDNNKKNNYNQYNYNFFIENKLRYNSTSYYLSDNWEIKTFKYHIKNHFAELNKEFNELCTKTIYHPDIIAHLMQQYPDKSIEDIMENHTMEYFDARILLYAK